MKTGMSTWLTFSARHVYLKRLKGRRNKKRRNIASELKTHKRVKTCTSKRGCEVAPWARRWREARNKVQARPAPLSVLPLTLGRWQSSGARGSMILPPILWMSDNLWIPKETFLARVCLTNLTQAAWSDQKSNTCFVFVLTGSAQEGE